MKITDTINELRIPAAWNDGRLADLMACKAGRAYILDQFGVESIPEHEWDCGRGGSDRAAYLIWDDGSILYVNNAEDEVWADFRDFIADQLIPCLSAMNATGNLRWDEPDEDDNPAAYRLDEGTRSLILHYCDGDEPEARELLMG